MNNNIFQINLDLNILSKLRDKVNEQKDVSYNKFYKKYRAWDKICAIMDRLDDTVNYLNELKLNTGNYKSSAFDFYNFMNNASVVVDCIKELVKIFKLPNDTIKKSTEIFNQLGSDGEGTDENYFEYLRSLCAVHPVGTDRHKRYQANDFECSPYVVWNNREIWQDDCDLYAVVYTSKDGDDIKRVLIYISQIFDYVKMRLNFVNEIINAIDQYQKQVIFSLKNRPIKNEKEFDNYIDYLKNLDKEKNERYGLDNFIPFNYVINLFELKLSNPKNKSKMELYLNAMKYAIKFEHSRLQNMSVDGFQNNELLYPKKNIETSLYSELCLLNSGSDEQRKYRYNIEKIDGLSYDTDDSNRNWAYSQIKQALPFLEKYVSFQDAKGDFEHYALVQLALYLHCLDNKCLINRNIPNDLKYRNRVLSDEEWNELLT